MPYTNRVLVMRHPQTQGNLEDVFVGQKNSPLSELGQKQCQEAVQALIAWKPERIISSPLERCLAIAKPVSEKLNLELEIDPEIIEMNFGVIEGIKTEDLYKQGIKFPWQIDEDVPFVEGAESMSELKARVGSAFDRYAKDARRSALICHGGVMRTIAAHVLGLDAKHTFKLVCNNVSSCIYQIHEGSAFVEGLFLNPSELIERAKHE